MSEGKLKVDITRHVTGSRVIKGIKVVEDMGLNYVDAYFPDGSQRTWGYIGRNPVKGSQFSPLAGCPQVIADLIQKEINRQLECDESNAAPPPVMISYDDRSDEEDDED